VIIRQQLQAVEDRLPLAGGGRRLAARGADAELDRVRMAQRGDHRAARHHAARLVELRREATLEAQADPPAGCVHRG